MTSTAGDATLSVHDPSAVSPGHLVNGSHVLAQPLRVNGGGVRGASNPTPIASWAGPVSSAPLTIALEQSVAASDPLRTGSYAKTLVFTLSTTSP